MPPHGRGDARDDAANPTDFLLVLGPIRKGREAAGVVEIFQRPDAPPNAQRGHLRFLLDMCNLTGGFLTGGNRTITITVPPGLWFLP